MSAACNVSDAATTPAVQARQRRRDVCERVRKIFTKGVYLRRREAPLNPT
jgi:hypothetical protein